MAAGADDLELFIEKFLTQIALITLIYADFFFCDAVFKKSAPVCEISEICVNKARALRR